MSENKYKIITTVLLIAITLLLGYLAFGMYKVVGAIPKQISTQEILDKLYAHTELSKYKGTTPQAMTQVTPENIQQLAQQIQGLDQSYLGAIAIGFPDRIIMYDYNSDTILANIPVTAQQPQSPEAAGQTAPSAPKTSTATVTSTK